MEGSPESVYEEFVAVQIAIHGLDEAIFYLQQEKAAQEARMVRIRRIGKEVGWEF